MLASEDLWSSFSEHQQSLVKTILDMLGDDLDAATVYLQDVGIEVEYEDLEELSEMLKSMEKSKKTKLEINNHGT